MYKSILWLSCTFFLFLCCVPTLSNSTVTADTGCGQAISQYGSCFQIINLGWIALGGPENHDPQSWETRMMLSGVEKDYPYPCNTHAIIMIFDPHPLPPTGGDMNSAKKILVNYFENHDGEIPGAKPKVSTSAGISDDFKNGESKEFTLYSSVDNPLMVKGASVAVIFITTSRDCQNGRVPMYANYLAKQPIGYTFTVFQNEPFAVAPKWYFPAEGLPVGSRAGFTEMAFNVYNPSSVKQVPVHVTAYDQLGRLVASTASDRVLDPMETWSPTLSQVLGPTMENFLGRVYVSGTTGPIIVTTFKRVGLGMSAPAARPTIY